GADLGAARLAAEIAAVLSEHGLGGTAVDLEDRIRRLRQDRSPRAEDARRLAQRWARLAGTGRTGAAPASSASNDPADAGRLLALAYPDRVAQARGAPGGFRLMNGRGAMLEPHEALARQPWLAVAEVQGTAARARILLAAPLSIEAIEADFAGHIREEVDVRFDEAAGAVRARRVRRLGALVLGETPVADPPADRVAAALMEGVRRRGLAGLPWSKAAHQLRMRVGFARRADPEAWPDLSDPALSDSLETWLAPHVAGRRSIADIRAEDLGAALDDLLGWSLKRDLERLAPTHFAAPSGTHATIDYEAENGPVLSIRVQELYGLDRHPAIADGRVPLLVELLSPAHRPIQVTRDLPGFWRGSWKEVRTEMKGRYPRHVWPDDPATAEATTRAKPRGT
ncbi:ATP-dependent helicase HrpB, partial [Prosthecomicrobium hirschii]|uniref:ATP-dependent helicase C-terminal domain-containing protein n=1 Tax=Prosthecodimorpha hirschii TaxID=665126 RepID=UPI001D46309B